MRELVSRSSDHQRKKLWWRGLDFELEVSENKRDLRSVTAAGPLQAILAPNLTGRIHLAHDPNIIAEAIRSGVF